MILSAETYLSHHEDRAAELRRAAASTRYRGAAAGRRPHGRRPHGRRGGWSRWRA